MCKLFVVPHNKVRKIEIETLESLRSPTSVSDRTRTETCFHDIVRSARVAIDV